MGISKRLLEILKRQAEPGQRLFEIIGEHRRADQVARGPTHIALDQNSRCQDGASGRQPPAILPVPPLTHDETVKVRVEAILVRQENSMRRAFIDPKFGVRDQRGGRPSSQLDRR
jgi:hypothetical protein